MENEEKAKKRLIEKLQKEHEMLKKINNPPRENLQNDATFTKRKEKLEEDLKIQKAKLKEKHEELQKKEKLMNEQHEKHIVLEEKCRKIQKLMPCFWIFFFP